MKLSEKYHKTIAQILLRRGLQRGYVVLPKSIHYERIKENFAVFDFTLSEEDMHEIATLDMGYCGTRTKHFDPCFREDVSGSQIQDNHRQIGGRKC